VSNREAATHFWPDCFAAKKKTDQKKVVMSHTKLIGDLISQTGTYVELERKMAQIQASDPTWTADDTRELKVRWGRKLLGQRLLNTACMVITNACYGFTTPYAKVQNEVALGANHNWMYHLTDHFADLCLENKWPHYGVMIVHDAGNTPKGFFKWYEKRVLGYPVASQSTVEQTLRSECTTTQKTPDAVEIALAVTKYIHNHNL
jgi:hypothetical protein